MPYEIVSSGAAAKEAPESISGNGFRFGTFSVVVSSPDTNRPWCPCFEHREAWGSPHGIAFEDAIRIFEGSTVERVDDRFDYGERRVYAIGLVNGLEITLIYTDRESEERRIISAWRAEPHERRRYWKNVEG